MSADLSTPVAPAPTGGWDQKATPYVDAVLAHAAGAPGNFNVPTHKAGRVAPAALVAAVGQQALAIDVPPQVHGVDMGPPPAPWEAAERLAADAWGAQRTWFMLNGASQANHTACLTLAQAGGRRLVVQRNVHGSTIDGLVLAGLEPVFVRPEVDLERGISHCVSPDTLDRVLRETDEVAGVVLVSPTYYGAAADVPSLVEICRRHDVPVVIDEAWGSHFAFSDLLPRDAIACGADLVISSTHKMLGSLTQSAMLHLGPNARVDADAVARAISLTQTTSPNALLFASLDAARQRAATEGAALLERTIPVARALRERLCELPGVEVLDERVVGTFGVAGLDPLRVSIDVRGTGRNGFDLQAALRMTANVLVELTSDTMLVAIVGMGETEQEVGRLVDGLRSALAATRPRAAAAVEREPPWGRLRMAPRAAFLGPTRRIALHDAVGAIAAESLAVYPPGSPNVLPGEEVTGAVVRHLERAAAAGAVIRGAVEQPIRTIRVVDETPMEERVR